MLCATPNPFLLNKICLNQIEKIWKPPIQEMLYWLPSLCVFFRQVLYYSYSYYFTVQNTVYNGISWIGYKYKYIGSVSNQMEIGMNIFSFR